jgi:archaellum component FlaC
MSSSSLEQRLERIEQAISALAEQVQIVRQSISSEGPIVSVTLAEQIDQIRALLVHRR